MSYLDVFALSPENGDNKSKQVINFLIAFVNKKKKVGWYVNMVC